MKSLICSLNSKYIHANLAVRLLYELNKEQSGLRWKEFTIKENPDDIVDYCKEYDLVAFSCYIWNITQTLLVCEKLKEINPKIKILLGGPEVSYDYQNVISKNFIDYIIVGEGEIAFKEFLNAFPNVNSVRSLVYKSGDAIIESPSAPIFDVKEFEDLMPYQSDNVEELKNKVLYIETSRGCPYKCEFCLASLDNKVRYLPQKHIEQTLLYLMEHGRVIKFLDRTFNMKRDFTLWVFNFILENHKPGNVFQFEITADILHPDIIAFIKEKVPKGLFRFEIGIQTVNQKANLEVSRKQNFEKTKQIILSIYDYVELHLDLIVGLPLDYWDDIKYSFEEVFKLFAPELQLGFLKFLKGTPVRYKYKEHGFEFDENPPYQIIRSNYLSEEELSQIVKQEHALEIYWNKKRAINTLRYVTQKYGSFDFLLGLGAFFGTKKEYHQYSLTDVFDIITDYAKINYPDDSVLRELIAIDYYLHYKVKPKTLYLDEVGREQKQQIIQDHKLNLHQFRYIVLPLSFNFDDFVLKNEIFPESYNLIVEYSGEAKARVVKPGDFITC
ncbi:MAG: B12-binding domain-containing radical SAM protein [Bacteroidetes bacterium]|nr:B12-binding domain-containing radical SAM protein [Bacteroidota bacterium]